MFFNRINYEVKAQETSSKYSNFIDFNFAEKRFYGKVNRNFVPIVLMDRLNNLKTLPVGEERTAAFRAVNFVVDQFILLSKQFEKCSLIGKISPSDKYLSKLKVYNAYTSVDQIYQSYINDLRLSISNTIKSQNKKITSFQEFLTEVDNYFDTVSKDRPVTLQGFIRSKFATPLISGLSIEIADLDFVNDQEKVENFYNSKNWEFYVNTCKSFGFMVDKDVPWRITADLASVEMLNAASRYGFSTTDSVLNRLFNYRINQNYLSFINSLNTMAVQTIADYFFVDECQDGSLKQKRAVANIDLTKVTQEQYLKIYLKMRMREEEIKLSEYDYKIIESNMISEARENRTRAIFKVELFLSKPYELSGSLTDKLRKLNGV